MRNAEPPDNGPTGKPARPARPTRRTLTRDDWARAALTALRESGLPAVAVEPLAERLGTTKGSFYWHFKDRDSLIRAALELWVAESEELMAEADRAGDPAARGRWMAEYALGAPHSADVSTTLLMNSAHPVVAEFLEPVSTRRLEFATRLNADQGLSADRARHHALMAWAVLVGLSMIRRGAPQLLPQGEDREEFLRYLLDMLLPRPGTTDPGPPPRAADA